MRHPELLAPAGGRESLRAAVAAGADAVYFGLSEFSARARAENFKADELPSLMDLLRRSNVRGYAAMNTLLFPEELDRAAALLAKLAEAGVDAVIVQDLGLARLAREMAPSLPVHASTQMSLAHGSAVALMRKLFNVERVILPRELSAEQIRAVAASSDAELEVFVHGSLCLSYGGQCLASASLGGRAERSGNRGSCAQPCRLPYTLSGKRGFPLSPLDLSAWELLPELVSIGVKGFKIEGRLKSGGYVGAATGFYRRALDAALEGKRFEPSGQDILDLAQGFSRGFTRGWLGKVPRGSIVEGAAPESRGILAGKVIRRTPSGVLIEPVLGLKPGDGVAFGSGETRTGGRIVKLLPRGKLMELRLRSDPGLLRPGTEVRKTSDARPPRPWTFPPRREPLDMEVRAPLGGAFRIKAKTASGREAETVWETTLAKAEKHPISPELLREQLGRLGDTPFRLGRLSAPVLDPVLVPKSVLNRLRRELLAGLLRPRTRASDPDALERLRSRVLPVPSIAPPELMVLVRDPAQLQAALSSGCCDLSHIYCDFPDFEKVPPGAAVAGPRVLEPGDEAFLEALLRLRPPAVLVRNLATLALMKGHGAELVADWRLNASNPLSAQALFDMGFSRVTPAYDLGPEGLEDLLRRCGAGRFEVLAYQHVEMFHTKHCFHSAAFLNGRECPCCPSRCSAPSLRLKDRKGVTHSIRPDGLGRSTVFHDNAESRSMGLRCGRFRVELLGEGPQETSALLERFSRALSRAQRR
ncbi:MAG: DUF3656 domain-containing protein [Elusimicrobiota bacterium]